MTGNPTYSAKVAGWMFIAGGLMLALGWLLLPAKIDTFFESGDFAAVGEVFQPWIWLFRVHIFGYVVSVMALAALAALVAGREERVLIWPAVAVAASGLIVGAIGAAFYYHHGAWGALAMEGRTAEEIAAHVEALEIDTEYVTCLVRFSRVFFGLGLVVLAWGLHRARSVPAAIGIGAFLVGVAAMFLTMAFPDDLHFYAPVFYLGCLWLIATGAVLVRSGLRPAGGAA